MIRRYWTRGLVSLLGLFEILMATSAGPVTTIAAGVIGGAAVVAAPWVTGRARTASIPLIFLGTLPFAVLTYWSLVSPLLAVVALTIGLTTARRAHPLPE